MSICEGEAEICGDAFYNKTQVYNRDLSVAVVKTFRKTRNENLTLLDAFTATGLRAIRYKKEVEGLEVVVNDLDKRVYETLKKIYNTIQLNVELN